MTSLAWGPVGHCTSVRPLNPPLRTRICSDDLALHYQ